MEGVGHGGGELLQKLAKGAKLSDGVDAFEKGLRCFGGMDRLAEFEFAGHGMDPKRASFGFRESAKAPDRDA
ncbi:hypothetical protein HAHE_35380 [Haloferula helveola]|uniref:Uncharacterized protein n=1 Tax=Haloferula helveola TaxID=490095 RepID=A0ABM7RH87_9BACT|nr:hypothetical protein HAHE_35380 [Haloferula helveola]